MTPIHAYGCPDCGQAFTSGRHQHADGEWVYTEDLRRYYQFRRWERLFMGGAGLAESAARLFQALENCVNLLIPDRSMEDQIFRAEWGERMLVEAKALLKELKPLARR